MVRVVFGPLSYALGFALLVFGPAGTLEWWRGWVLVGTVMAARVAVHSAVDRVHPGLLVERRKSIFQPGQPFADRILLPGFMLAYAALLAFASFDANHHPLLPPPGP